MLRDVLRDMLRVVVIALAALTCTLPAAAQSPAAQASDPAALAIETKALPKATAGQPYEFRLMSSGGTLPIRWTLETRTPLPAGLRLDSASGTISGTPRQPGEFRLTVTAVDASTPHQRAQQNLVLTVLGPLAIEWRNPPHVSGNAISGSVVLSNTTGDAMDLTVIILAVNAIGRATALAYQHIILQPHTTDLEITFSGTPGAGQYIVHADAIGEVAATNTIYRSRVQTERPLTIATP